MSLDASLAEFGLHRLAVVPLEAAEIETFGFADDCVEVALIGNTGSSYWPFFSAADEFHDGEADPLDRWSRRVAESIAARHGLTPIYPFDGPPYYPFQRWAARAGDFSASPLGILIHPRYGLWQSYRFALLGAGLEPVAASAGGTAACADCRAQPCLGSCPVDAFTGDGYAVDACAAYLREHPACACLATGCRARHACPVAPDFEYLPEQSRFHLRAFLGARS